MGKALIRPKTRPHDEGGEGAVFMKKSLSFRASLYRTKISGSLQKRFLVGTLVLSTRHQGSNAIEGKRKKTTIGIMIIKKDTEAFKTEQCGFFFLLVLSTELFL